MNIAKKSDFLHTVFVWHFLKHIFALFCFAGEGQQGGGEEIGEEVGKKNPRQETKKKNGGKKAENKIQFICHQKKGKQQKKKEWWSRIKKEIKQKK